MHNETALFKVLADPTRLRLAVLLSIRGEKCVCQLVEALNEPGFKISRHLGIMRSAGMVDVRREGTWMHYTTNLQNRETIWKNVSRSLFATAWQTTRPSRWT